MQTSYSCIEEKEKLKINLHRHLGNRVVFDDEGNTIPQASQDC
jgi:hypothetical protein